MHGHVTSGAPASAEAKVGTMGDFPDINLDPSRTRNRNLRVALETEIGIPLDQHLRVDRSVGIVTGGATLPQSLMLVDMHAALFPVTRCAGFVLTCHRETARRLEEIQPMGIMALNAAHLALGNGMVLRKMKLTSDLKMTFITSAGIRPRIGNESPTPAPRLNMKTARAMAGLAAMEIAAACLGNLDLRVPTHRKATRDIGMTVKTGLIPDESGSFNMGWNEDCAFNRTAGAQTEAPRSGQQETARHVKQSVTKCSVLG